MSSSRSTSAASTLAVPGRSSSRSAGSPQLRPHDLEGLSHLLPGVVRAAQPFLVEQVLRLGEELPGALHQFRGGGAVGDWVTLAAATSASMTRSVWYQDGPRTGRTTCRRMPASARPTGRARPATLYPAPLDVCPDLVGEVEEAESG